MYIGIYVTSLTPHSPSQARLQQEIFSGLEALGIGRYRFLVFSWDGNPPAPKGAFSYHAIARRGAFAQAFLGVRAGLARAALALWGRIASGGRMHGRLAAATRIEPAHYEQMRDLDVRLLWNMHQHELKVPVPFIRTIWEANHRIHSMFPEYAYARYGFDGVDAGMADSLARASYVVTGTETGKQEIIQMLGVYPGKVRVAPFPTPQVTQAAPAAAKTDPYIFYPARFWPHKNHAVVLEALKFLKDEGLRITCVLTGADEGNLGHVMQYAGRLGIRDQIDYRGRVPDAELMSLYAGAVALVYASAVGPDNLPPLEAMAVGCPVIAADVPGAREQYGEAALFFPPADEAALARQIRSFMKNPELRHTMIARGRSQVEGYTSAEYGRRMMAIFDEFSLLARNWARCDSPFT